MSEKDEVSKLIFETQTNSKNVCEHIDKEESYLEKVEASKKQNISDFGENKKQNSEEQKDSEAMFDPYTRNADKTTGANGEDDGRFRGNGKSLSQKC